MIRRILIGLPEAGARGGILACEPSFVRELRQQGIAVSEETYGYADTGRGVLRRLYHVLATALRFRRRLLNGGFEVVHINSAFTRSALLRDVIVTSLLPRSSARIFLKLHGSDQTLIASSNPLWKLLRRRLLARCDAIGVLSMEERAAFVASGANARRLFAVPNAVDPPAYRSLQFVQTWHLPQDCPLILFTGRFIQSKGILDLIHAGALLKESGQPFTLLFLGDGPLRQEAESLARELGLAEHVRFPGHVPEEQASSFYANATMLVFPTYHTEGFSMTVFRAVAAGLPVVTTRIRAAADYLSEPDNCLWVEAHRPDQVAVCIRRLLDDSGLRDRMREANRKVAEQFFPVVVARVYMDIYMQLTSSGHE